MIGFLYDRYQWNTIANALWIDVLCCTQLIRVTSYTLVLDLEVMNKIP